MALMAHDVALSELTQAQWLTLVQGAARDSRNSGWVLKMEDNESLTVVSGTYEYTMPATFAYLERVYLEDTSEGTSVYNLEVPRGHWDIGYNDLGAGAVPTLKFATLTAVNVGKKLKLVGQKRPTIYALVTETVDPGMDSFLRERALFFGFRFLAAGRSEYATWRQQMALLSYQTSETMLKRHPQEFRPRPSSIVIPTRE